MASKFASLVSRISFPLGRRLLVDLIFYFILLTTLPAIAIGYLTANRARNETTQLITNQMESVAELKHKWLVNWLSQGDYALKLIMADSGRYDLVINLVTPQASSEGDDGTAVLR